MVRLLRSRFERFCVGIHELIYKTETELGNVFFEITPKLPNINVLFYFARTSLFGAKIVVYQQSRIERGAQQLEIVSGGVEYLRGHKIVTRAYKCLCRKIFNSSSLKHLRRAATRSTKRTVYFSKLFTKNTLTTQTHTHAMGEAGLGNVGKYLASCRGGLHNLVENLGEGELLWIIVSGSNTFMFEL